MLFLSLLLLQTQKFNEFYDAGIEAFENKNYRESIRLLTRATELRAESSPNAKISGVRFIAYYPYHYLATASYLLKDIESAAKYMELAYANHEDEEARIGEKLQFLKIFLDEWRNNSNSSQTPTVYKVDLGPVFEFIKSKRYRDAIQLLNAMRANDALNTDVYSMMIRLLDELQSSVEKVAEVNTDRQKKLIASLEEARAKAEAGAMADAYIQYQKVKFLDPSNKESTQFIEAYDRQEEESNSEEYKALLEQVAALKSEKEKRDKEIAENERAAQRRIEDLIQILESSKKTVPQLLPTISLLKIADQVYQISVQYQGGTLLGKAFLNINGKKEKEWVLSQKTSFTAEHQQSLVARDNVIQIDIFDQAGTLISQAKTHFTPPVPTRIRPDRNQRPLKILLIAFSILLFASYWVLQRNQRKAFRLRFNPYIAGAPVMKEDMFYGREALLKQILNTIHNNSLMIYGERRIGKTSFLHQLYTLLPDIEDPSYLYIPVMIDLQGVDETQFFHHLHQEIEAAVLPWQVVSDPIPESMNGREFTQHLRATIQALKSKCPKPPKLVLLLDEVDIMNGYSERTNQQLRAVFMKGFAQHLVAIMAGINISKRWKSEGSPWYNFFEQIELKPFSRDQAEELVTRPVKGIYRYETAAIDQILQISHCKPYIIQKLCVNLIAHVLNENKRSITAKDVRFVYEEIKHEVEAPA